MNETYDLLIVVLFDMFNGEVRYQVIPIDQLTEPAKADLTLMDMGWLSTSNIPITDELNLLCIEDKQTTYFPLKEVKQARNPKIFSVILD